MTTPSIEKAARAICAAYGDEYDEQPADLDTLREWRRAQGAVGADGRGEVRAYDPGLPTQAGWKECAVAALETLLDDLDEEVAEHAAKAMFDADNGIDGDAVGDMIYDNFRIEARDVEEGTAQAMSVCRVAARAALRAAVMKVLGR